VLALFLFELQAAKKPIAVNTKNNFFISIFLIPTSLIYKLLSFGFGILFNKK
jgi:hypothetical protein